MLYKWQKECLEEWEKNRCRGIINVITGGGKTVLALSAANRFCGMVFGLASGMILIWIFMIVASFIFGAAYDGMIAQSEVLALIDKNNLVLYLIHKL